MKILKIFIIILIITPLSALCAQQTAVISNNYVRVRAEPDTASKVLMYVNSGDVVNVIEQSKDKQKIGKMTDFWYKIKLENNTEGWVYGAFVKFAEAEEVLQTTTTNNQNITVTKNDANIPGAFEIKPNEVIFYEDSAKSKVVKKIPCKRYNRKEQLNNLSKYGKDSCYVYNEVLSWADGVLVKETTQMKDSKITRLDFYDTKGAKTGSVDVIFDYRISPDFRHVVIMPAKSAAGYYGDKIVFYGSNGKLVSQYDCSGISLLYNQAFSPNSGYFGLIRQKSDGTHELLIFDSDGKPVKQETVEASRKLNL